MINYYANILSRIMPIYSQELYQKFFRNNANIFSGIVLLRPNLNSALRVMKLEHTFVGLIYLCGMFYEF